MLHEKKEENCWGEKQENRKIFYRNLEIISLAWGSSLDPKEKSLSGSLHDPLP